MYSLFRIIIFVILFILCILLYRKKNCNINKDAIIVISIINITLCTILFLIPIENLFLKFESPEKVFNNGNLIDVIEGDKSGMILYYKGNTYSFTIIPKVENNWKLGTIKDYKEIVNKNIDGGVINIYKYNNSEDYYITIMFLIIDKEDNNTIYDNINSNFEKFSKDINNTNKKTSIYYSNIKNFNDKYIVTVNNVNINFND